MISSASVITCLPLFPSPVVLSLSQPAIFLTFVPPILSHWRWGGRRGSSCGCSAAGWSQSSTILHPESDFVWCLPNLRHLQNHYFHLVLYKPVQCARCKDLSDRRNISTGCSSCNPPQGDSWYTSLKKSWAENVRLRSLHGNHYMLLCRDWAPTDLPFSEAVSLAAVDRSSKPAFTCGLFMGPGPQQWLWWLFYIVPCADQGCNICLMGFVNTHWSSWWSEVWYVHCMRKVCEFAAEICSILHEHERTKWRFKMWFLFLAPPSSVCVTAVKQMSVKAVNYMQRTSEISIISRLLFFSLVN